MNDKYKKYIEYIANDIQVPYLKSLEPYGLKQEEMNLVLGIVFNQPVTIKGRIVYEQNGNNIIHYEDITGFWEIHVYNTDGKVIYHEDSYGNWYKKEFDQNGKIIYIETSTGYIEDNRYEKQI